MKKLNQRLLDILSPYSSIVVAYSGGVDSAVLMEAAHRVLGKQAYAVLADSASLPRSEFESASCLAKERSWNFHVLKTDEFENPQYRENPVNRCYFCKTALFKEMEQFSREQKVAALAYGENADDLKEERWGRVAAEEFKVIAPLREAGLTKAEVRELAREWGLPVADKIASPCLSSRVLTGVSIEKEDLLKIEQGEEFLKSIGFELCRVRFDGKIAKVIVSEEQLSILKEKAAQVRETLKKIGFEEVEISSQPYRGASLR